MPRRRKDQLQLARSLNVRRLGNIALLRSSYYLSRLLKKDIHWGLPFSASIEPTTSCNLRCPECPSGLRSFSRNTGNIQLEDGKRIIDSISKTCAYINFYFQGEPLISPNLFELVAYARSKNIYTATSTNAHFLTESNCKKLIQSGLNRLIISIDGTTQDTYESYRKEGDLNKVIVGTKTLISEKKKAGKGPHIIFQFLVVRPNEHQVKNVFELAKKLEVDEVRLKTAQVYDYKHGNDLIPENEEYSRYSRQKDGTYKLKGSPGNHCWRMWAGAVFTWDGNVVPCCFDKDAKYKMGNVLDTPIKTIIQSPSYRDFRKQLLTARSQIDICNNCSEGTKVWN